MLNSKFRGYFNYYGVIGNSKGINEFYEVATENTVQMAKSKKSKEKL